MEPIIVFWILASCRLFVDIDVSEKCVVFFFEVTELRRSRCQRDYTDVLQGM